MTISTMWMGAKEWMRDALFARLFILFIAVPVLSAALFVTSLVRCLMKVGRATDIVVWQHVGGVRDPAMFVYWNAIWNPDSDDGRLMDRLINLADEHARRHSLSYVLFMSILLVLAWLI